MIRALINSFKLVTDPSCRKVLLFSIFLALVVFVLIGWLASAGFATLPQFDTEWMNTLASIAARLGFIMVAWLIFPWVVSLFVGLFLDRVAGAAEEAFYPGDEPGQEMPLGTAFFAAFRYGMVIIGANLAVLPVYIFFIWLPFAPFAIYYGLNAYLLSREYFELVAHRHVGWTEARRLRKAYQGRITLGGLVIAVMFSMPLINLITPVVATAFMVQIFKDIEAREKRRNARRSRERPEYKSMRERLESDEL